MKHQIEGAYNMTIEFINKRISGKEAELAKLEKKLSRIEKAQESNWEINPYYYSESDLKWTKRDIENVKNSIEEYKGYLKEAEEKKASRNVPAITEFLDRWYDKSVEFFTQEKAEYDIALKERQQKNREYSEWYNRFGWTMRRENPEEYKRIDKEETDERNNFRMKWSHVTQFNHGDLSWEETMRKDLLAEKDRKYDFMVERATRICGVIEDAKYLTIGDTGELNGYVSGPEGKCSITTFGAGGWNIQRYHFRTSFRKIK